MKVVKPKNNKLDISNINEEIQNQKTEGGRSNSTTHGILSDMKKTPNYISTSFALATNSNTGGFQFQKKAPRQKTKPVVYQSIRQLIGSSKKMSRKNSVTVDSSNKSKPLYGNANTNKNMLFTSILDKKPKTDASDNHEVIKLKKYLNKQYKLDF